MVIKAGLLGIEMVQLVEALTTKHDDLNPTLIKNNKTKNLFKRLPVARFSIRHGQVTFLHHARITLDPPLA